MRRSASYFDTKKSNTSEGFYHGFVLGMLSSFGITHYIRSNRESGLGRYGYPKIKLQYALKFFDDAYKDSLKINPCDAVRTSFGLIPDGTLLASPWAINNRGNPLDDVWMFGNLFKKPLESILAQEKAKVFLSRQNENFGQCKIHAFLASKKEKKIDETYAQTRNRSKKYAHCF
ncbi:hypothetical protein [Candidatus Cardinium hertigii]|uniref:hypothetical protein n=1 Tax=Candidatus Cardinium hertigii TaxID=247481 RepID=UPI0013A54EA2|nr:hypothetical protein [Candidatus Cardinium hertigii]